MESQPLDHQGSPKNPTFKGGHRMNLNYYIDTKVDGFQEDKYCQVKGGVCVPKKWESQNPKWASTPQVPGCSTYDSQ